MIAIVNYGSGNIQALGNIYGKLGVPFVVAATPAELAAADRIILPGVGAFEQAMGELNASGMREALDAWVLDARKPILGICVGMQLFAKSSEEGTAPGLGWIDGAVRLFDRTASAQATQLPHMGWNTISVATPDPLFAGIDMTREFYFLHSYHFCCHDQADVLATTDYGVSFSSAVGRQHIRGVQFHPEKSHQNGIQLLANFARL